MKSAKKIFILNVHPRANSLGDALARAYKQGAIEAGFEVRFTNLRDLNFDPILRATYRDNVLEPDLVKEQENIKWCDHWVIVTPVWWLQMPALLKGYIDRLITPGFAFKYKRGSLLPVPMMLLTGRSARVIYTQGGPKYLTCTIGFDSFWKSLKYGTLIFCGFFPVWRTDFCRALSVSDKKRKNWLKKAYQLGRKGR